MEVQVLHQSSAGMVDFGCVGMELHPPWAGELRARNRKVARNIWSTSDISNLENLNQRQRGGGWKGSKSFSEENETKVVDPVKRSSATATTSAKASSSSSSPTTMRTEKAASMRMRRDRDSSIEENSETETKCEVEDYMGHGGSGEESILEYGPGIVRKLRSKYQSLALRLTPARPTLFRSASLENGLDLDSGAEVTSPTFTPTPEPTPCPKVPERIAPPVPAEPAARTRAFRSNMTLNINDGSHLSRGRSEVNRRARMTRARSVDAINRVERTAQEEEILEKFKTVVEPKEEVVIIEVLKPRRNLGLGNNSQLSSPLTNTPTLTLHDKVESYNANANVIANGKPAGVGGHGTGSSDSQLGRGRALASPEYELPPADIVRETARIFETNPNTAGSHWKLLAKFATKSASVSPVSSPSSPVPLPSAPQIAAPPVTIPEKNQNGVVMSLRDKDPKHLQLNNQGKQIGVIRPTVNGVSKDLAPLKVVENSSGPPTVIVNITEAKTKVAAATARLLSNSNSKPPLSPKPMFISQTTKLSHNHVNGSLKGGDASLGSNEQKEVTNRSNRSPSPVPVQKPIQNPRTDNRGSDNNVPPPYRNGLTSTATSNESENTTSKSKPTIFPVTLKPVSGKSATTTENPLIQSKREILNGSINGRPVNSSEPGPGKSTIGQQSKVSNNPSIANSTKTTMSSKDLQSNGKDAESKNGVGKTKDGKENMGGVPPQPSQQPSTLRAHQKQKFSEQQNGGGPSIVFNFMGRDKVPDYIEDDGLHRNGGGVEDSVDDVDSIDPERIDPELFQFTGANVIINGKSSIQKKPKSQKMNIKFNENGPTTFEYPSEASILTEEDSDSNNLLGQRTPNLINGSGGGLGNYTPSKVSNLYQLGSYKERLIDSNNKKPLPSEEKSTKADNRQNGDFIEDYLKPDTEGTTWSNEIGAADILF